MKCIWIIQRLDRHYDPKLQDNLHFTEDGDTLVTLKIEIKLFNLIHLCNFINEPAYFKTFASQHFVFEGKNE